MMNILHFCTEPENHLDIAQMYLTTLTERMAKVANVRIVKATEDYRSVATDFAPHIIHIHTCWNHPSALMAKWSHGHNIPVVLSPHGNLEPWIVDQNYLHEKLPKLLLYQHEMICNADAIVVAGEMERQSISKLSWNEHFRSRQPWNDRVALIKNSIVTNDVSDQEMCDQMMELYRKVIDSNAWMLMDAATREAENGLLRCGIARGQASNTVTEHQLDLIRQLDGEAWRKLMIHAEDEDVLHIIRAGIANQAIEAPDIDVSAIDRFSPQRPKAKGALPDKQLLDASIRNRFKPLAHFHANERLEMNICRMIANISHEMRQATLSLRHLTELYEVFRFADYDEELLSRMLNELELNELTIRLQDTLADMLGLTEGFMPLES